MKTRKSSLTSYALWGGSALVLALAAACSSNNLGTGSGDGGIVESDDIAAPLDSGKDSTTNDACVYTPVTNDPACPTTYSYALGGQPCVPVGLQCQYPGAGDGENGCYATAVLICYGDGGFDDRDAGEDGGRQGTWSASQ